MTDLNLSLDQLKVGIQIGAAKRILRENELPEYIAERIDLGSTAASAEAATRKIVPILKAAIEGVISDL